MAFSKQVALGILLSLRPAHTSPPGLCEANWLTRQLTQPQQPLFSVTLIEKGPSLVNGPPFCHLHAGGNLYREIPDEQCTVLLEQCIEICRLFPHCMDRRQVLLPNPSVVQAIT